MMELLNLQQQCLNLIQVNPKCSQNCALNHYCTSVGCTTGIVADVLTRYNMGCPTSHTAVLK